MVDAPNTIVTDRLVLRKPRPSDDQFVHEFASDPDVTRYVNWPRHSRLSETVARRKEALRKWETGEDFSWRIVLRTSEEPIGTIGCRLDGHAVEFGYVFGKAHWGHGYATEASKAVLEWAKHLEGIYRILASCDTENVASARVLEKAGLSLEGTLRCHTTRPNVGSDIPRDDFIYAWVS